MTKLFAPAAIAFSLLFASGPASAQTAVGRIQIFTMASPGNMAFRVILDSAPADCALGILYVDFASPNYQAFVSGLLLAYAQGKQVTFTYVPNYAIPGQSLNACMIQEYFVQ